MNAPTSLETPQVAKLTVEDFLTLDQAGAFDGHSKTELLDGVVLYVNAQYAPHFKLKTKLLRRLADACDSLGGLFAWSEGGVEIRPHNVPEPDVIVTRLEPDEGLISVDTVALVVEVASTTLSTDLGFKARLYARAGIPEYWVADVSGRVIHQLWSPAVESYEERQEISFGEPVHALTITGLVIDTRDL